MEVTVFGVIYEKARRIVKYGSIGSIKKYLRHGYKIKNSGKGMWVLCKPSKLYLSIIIDDKFKKINIKDEVMRLYNVDGIDHYLVSKLEYDLDNGNVEVYNTDGVYSLRVVSNGVKV